MWWWGPQRQVKKVSGTKMQNKKVSGTKIVGGPSDMWWWGPWKQVQKGQSRTKMLNKKAEQKYWRALDMWRGSQV